MDIFGFFEFLKDGVFEWVYGMYRGVYDFKWVDVSICMDIFFLWVRQEARSPWCPCGLQCNGWIAIGHEGKGVRRPGSC